LEGRVREVIMDPFQDGWNMKVAVASVLRMAE